MRLSLLLVWIGAALVIGGVLFTAGQALWRGRLSGSLNRRDIGSDTLEPRERGSGLGLKANWPGIALIAFGFVLLLVGAVL